MRINNNLMAMNTHRQLGINGTNTQKSIEKLSSGMRINKAGDDAAGLAISEKMRGQIRGLNQSSRNAQDGISMVQTAEGALSESQSILQRMRELAVQAGNDTNTDVDRGEIQKEMNQLTSEINRIGNNTEFNTQKVLMGKEVTTSTPVAGAATVTGGTDAGVAVTPTAGAATLEGGADLIAAKPQVIEFTFSGDNFDATDTVSVGGETYTFTAGATSGTDVNIKGDLAASIDELASAINANGSSSFTAVSDGSSKLTLTQKVADGTAITDASVGEVDNNGTTTVGATSVTQSYSAETPAVESTGTITFSATDLSSVGTTITIDDKTYELTDGSGASGTNVEIDISGMTTNEEIIDALDTADVGSNSTISKTNATTLTVTADTAGVAGNTIATTVTPATAPEATAATGTITFDATKLAAVGTTITIDDATYELTDGTGASGTNVEINISGMTTNEQIIDALDTADVGSNSTISKTNATTLTVTTTATGAAANGTVATSVVGTASANSNFTATLQIGASQSQSFKVEINDMRASELGISGAAEGVAAGAGSEVVAGATFAAVADTDELTDNSGSTEYALDVSSNDKASAAIKVLDQAMTKVSSERSKLGAYQNRLEHTIRNLDTSSENLVAAESRVRDVDMAKEMMEFTKNNILQQAAQSMLAQANQQPQGVLQLLR